MILKALYDYYQHFKKEIPYGWMKIRVSFLIVLDIDGTFIRIEDCRDSKGNGLSIIAPKGQHTTAPTPMLLWDNVMYALDYSKNPTNKTREKHLSFVERCKDVSSRYNNKSLLAVSLFYERNELAKVKNDPLWEELKKNPEVIVSFKIHGSLFDILKEDCFEDIIKEEDVAKRAYCTKSVCLITGKKTEIVRIATNTPILHCKSSAKLVSFQKSSGYDSYGKEQANNAPISLEAEFGFSTALSLLTEQGSRNKFVVGNRTFVFWASNTDEASTKAEESLFVMLGIQEDKYDLNASIEEVHKVFRAIYSGELKTSLDDRFYILGLAPNSARIAVVYWSELVLRNFATNIKNHFERMNIVLPKSYKKLTYMGLRTILSAVTLGGNSSEVTPNLPEAIAKSVFEDTTYPISLFTACLCRLKTDSHDEEWDSFNLVDNIYKIRKIDTYIARFAIIKAFINKTFQNDIKEMLDKQNTNQGYLCGRLFAILERIQEISNRDKEYFTNVRSRYMSRASSEPAVVFPTMLSLSVHHSEKIENINEIVKYEKLKQEIIDNITDFPAHLSLHDQGRFFVGYYHQRQALFVYDEDQTND